MGKTALQMYSLRHLTETDLAGALKSVADIGFEGVEFAGYFGHSAQQLRGILSDLGLTPVGSHISIDTFVHQLDRQLDYSLELGEKYLICPGLPGEYTADKAAWQRTAELFNRIGQKVTEAGLVFGYHNHDSEFRPMGGERPQDILFSNVDSRYVKMELDTCWVEFGGAKTE